MKGAQFLVDDQGNKPSVLIDLKKNGSLWEDFYDQAVACCRKREPRESFALVKARLSSRQNAPGLSVPN